MAELENRSGTWRIRSDVSVQAGKRWVREEHTYLVPVQVTMSELYALTSYEPQGDDRVFLDLEELGVKMAFAELPTLSADGEEDDQATRWDLVEEAAAWLRERGCQVEEAWEACSGEEK